MPSPPRNAVREIASPLPQPLSRGPAGPGGNPEKPILRLNLMRALQLHRRLALGIALAGLVLAAAYIVRAWPPYTAQSQIYIQPVQLKVMSGADQSFTNNSAAYDSFVQQQVQSASNPEVLMSALHKLNAGQLAAERRERASRGSPAWRGHRGGSRGNQLRGDDYRKGQGSAVGGADRQRRRCQHRGASVRRGKCGQRGAIAVLREERDRIQTQLNSDYAEQNDLNKQLGMAAVGTEAPDLIDADIGKTREELIKAQTDHDQAQARFAAMGAGNGDSSAAIDAEADDLVAADAGLTSMKTSLNARRAS
jgi:uncharacterized protein involved in exopolysaccharide biosynthesis